MIIFAIGMVFTFCWNAVLLAQAIMGPAVTHRGCGITPDVNVSNDPSLLYDAFQDPTVNSAGFDEQRFFYFDSTAAAVRDVAVQTATTVYA